jgi:hypothetical protein
MLYFSSRNQIDDFLESAAGFAVSFFDRRRRGAFVMHLGAISSLKPDHKTQLRPWAESKALAVVRIFLPPSFCPTRRFG